MDTLNHFFTPATVLHARLEYGLGFVTCTALMLVHWHGLNLLQAIILFAYIDLLGTIPGMLAFRRSSDGNVSLVYYVLYNVMHSAITQSVVVVTYLLAFGWHWALLAIPAHLCADRSVFNNYPKPYSLAFEPVLHPVFQKFEDDYSCSRGTVYNWKSPTGRDVHVDQV